MSYLIGIDLGTSSVKVAVIHAHTLDVLDVSTAEYAIYHPSPNYAEQSPSDWWNATVKATKTVLKSVDDVSKVVGIGLSGQMHGLVCLDTNLEPVQNAIIWADARSGSQVDNLHRCQSEFSAVLPGLPAVGFAASSALWLKENAPQVLEKTYKWCLPKDYIGMRLTGNIVTEPSDAASTWLFDIETQSWAQEVYEYCGFSADQMPDIMPSGAVSGYLTNESAKELGLSPDTVVVAGSADLPAQALGQGITSPDTALIIVGTGGQIFMPIEQPLNDPTHRYYLFNHNLPNTWYVQAAILAGGLALRWLRDLLDLQTNVDAYQHLSDLADSIPAGAEGLIFLPYLAGERSPHMDEKASGMFFGLRQHHTTGHMVRAVMEGVAFALKDCLNYIPHESVKNYILAGGITNSSVWMQILADVLCVNLYVSSDDKPHGCVGATILAGLGTGTYTTLNDVNYTQHLHQIAPQEQQIYQDRFEQYRRLYTLLKHEMHLLNSSV